MKKYNLFFEKFKREKGYISEPGKTKDKKVFCECELDSMEAMDKVKAYLAENNIFYSSHAINHKKIFIFF